MPPMMSIPKPSLTPPTVGDHDAVRGYEANLIGHPLGELAGKVRLFDLPGLARFHAGLACRPALREHTGTPAGDNPDSFTPHQKVVNRWFKRVVIIFSHLQEP